MSWQMADVESGNINIWIDKSPTPAESHDDPQLGPVQPPWGVRIDNFVRNILHFGRQGRAIRKYDTFLNGYPSVAAFFDTPEISPIYRRYGYLSHRLILHEQAKLQKLEQQLNAMDIDDYRDDPERLKTSDLNDEEAASRQELISEIQRHYIEYSSLVDAARRLHKIDRPSKSDLHVIQSWFWEKEPLCRDDALFLNVRDDLISIKATPGILGRVWASNQVDHRQFPPKPHVNSYMARSRVNHAILVIVSASTTVLLAAPVYLLYRFAKDSERRNASIVVGILLIFTLCFATLLSLFTRAKRHEILAATASYSAVLVVFLGNIQQ